MMKLGRGLGSRDVVVLRYALIVVLSSGFSRCLFWRERPREREKGKESFDQMGGAHSLLFSELCESGM